jgi:hypothetical protein
MKWLQKLYFWKKVPLISVDGNLSLKYHTLSFEKEILNDWNALKFPDKYYRNEEAAGIVNAFKKKLIENYSCRYLSSGGSSNVYLHSSEKFVVKLCQVYGEEAPFTNYLIYRDSQDELPNWENRSDAYHYQQIRRILREHVLFPNYISDNCYLYTQRYIKQTSESREKIIKYFDNLLGPYQIQSWKRRTTWKDIAPINNISWCEEENRPYVIDI